MTDIEQREALDVAEFLEELKQTDHATLGTILRALEPLDPQTRVRRLGAAVCEISADAALAAVRAFLGVEVRR